MLHSACVQFVDTVLGTGCPWTLCYIYLVFNPMGNVFYACVHIVLYKLEGKEQCGTVYSFFLYRELCNVLSSAASNRSTMQSLLGRYAFQFED